MSTDSISTPSGDAPKSVFVVSPIGSPGSPEAAKAALVLQYIVREALPAPEWDVVRADEETDPSSITNKVIERIVNSDLIVADLTDHNPNVFYELAVAHGYRKPVVTIMTEGQKIPFDIVDLRTVFYDLANPASVHSAKERLRSSAQTVLSADAPINNPLVGYEIFSTASGVGDVSGASKFEFVAETILARLGHIENQISNMNSNQQVFRSDSSSSDSHATPMYVKGKRIYTGQPETAAARAKRHAQVIRRLQDYDQMPPDAMTADDISRKNRLMQIRDELEGDVATS